MAHANSESNSDGRIERVNRDRERFTALADGEATTVLASIDRDASRETILEELNELARALLRIVNADRRERARADGAELRSSACCPRCDAEITRIATEGPGDHRFAPCGHRAGDRHALQLVDDPELWTGGRSR